MAARVHEERDGMRLAVSFAHTKPHGLAPPTLYAELKAARGETQLVLIGGDAGVGKTRLIDELCRRLEALGGVAALGACVPSCRRRSIPSAA